MKFQYICNGRYHGSPFQTVFASDIEDFDNLIA